MGNHLAGLNWDDLRFFLVVSRAGYLARAARTLKVDHSTVSRRIAHLESTLGARLFERKREGLVLTELGRRLIDKLESMESQVTALYEVVSGQTTDIATAVRLSTYEGISSLYLASRLKAFQLEYPELRLEMVTQAQQVNVSRREADLFISFYEPEGRGLDKTRVGEITLHLFASEDYLARRGTPRTPAELARHDFVTYIDEHQQMETLRWLDDVIRDRREVFNSTSMITQMAAAAGGFGLVLLPIFAYRCEPRLVPVLPEEISVKRELWLSTHQDLRYAPRIKALINYLKTLIRNDHAYLNALSPPPE